MIKTDFSCIEYLRRRAKYYKKKILHYKKAQKWKFFEGPEWNDKFEYIIDHLETRIEEYNAAAQILQNILLIQNLKINMKTSKLDKDIINLKILTEGLTTPYVVKDFIHLLPDIERIHKRINLRLRRGMTSEQKDFLEASKIYFNNKLLILNKKK